MRKILWLFLLYPALLYQQNANITSLIKLDTVIDLQLVCDYDLIGKNDVKPQILNDKVWVFYPNWNENDSLNYLLVDLKSKVISKHGLYAPSLSFKTNSPVIKHFHVTDSALVILFSNNTYAYFKKEKAGYQFSFIEPLANSMEQVYCLNSKTLLFANMYNSHPKSNPDPVVLKVYDLKHKKIIKSVVPSFDGIEFSHFTPSHWLSVQGGQIVLSQTLNYKFSFYNRNLEKQNDVIGKSRYQWLYADTTFLKFIRGMKPQKRGKELIDLISPLEDSISRVEAIYYLSKTRILVRKVPAYSKAKSQERIIDVWEKKGNDWMIKYADYSDSKPKSDIIILKANYPLLSKTESVDFTLDYTVKIQPMFQNITFGSTFDEQKKQDERIAGEGVLPKFYLFIYRNNLR